MLIPLTVSADSGDWNPPSTQIVTGFPLKYGNGFGGVDPTTVKNYMDTRGWNGPAESPRLITMYEYTDDTHYTLDCYSTIAMWYDSAHIGNEPQLNLQQQIDLGYFGYRIRVTVNGNDITAQYGGAGYSIGLNLNNVLENNQNGQLVYKSGKYLNYPLWCQNYELKFANTNNIAFSESITPPPTTWDFTHAKGGFESAYQDLSDLPDVDDTPPSDPTSNSAWYQKILNGMKQIGRNLLAGTLLITQTMHNDIEGLQNGTKDIGDILRERLAEILAEFGVLIGKADAIRQLNQEQLDAIEDANAKSDPETISSEWNAGYNASTIKGMVDTGQALKTSLGSIGTRSTGRVTFGAWRLEYNGNDLHLIGNYSLPEIFGGGTHQQDLSFAWYNNCREWVIWVVKAFFYVGFAWYLLHQVPNMIQGAGTTFRNTSKGGKE